MISTTGEYALRAAVFLAQHHPEPQTTAQIAEGTKVPSGYLSKILQAMVRRAVIRSQRGLHGGFTLVREPENTSVLDILATVDAEPQRIQQCPLGLKAHVKLCPLHRLVDEAIEHAQKAFAKTNLEELSQSAEDSIPLCGQSASPCAPSSLKSRST
ncbi:Rrf2 family transcriptional regulator [Candidatus Sumerlaeota bacterium]|nr:Rrf2 family transcriptional regulator [Candidatus Sumerlaeota bacterium]